MSHPHHGARRLDLRGVPAEDVDLEPVVAHLRRGGLLAYPTETVYGLGCLLRPDALDRLRRLKGRDRDKPLLLLVAGVHSVADLRWTAEARELAGVFWPGALTLVLEDPDARYPAGVRSAAGAVAVRRTPHALAARLVERLGEPLTSTSANAPGEPAAADGGAALEFLVGLDPAEDVLVLDVGGLPPSPPSTIVDCTATPARVVRPGAVPPGRLRCVLPEIDGPRTG